LLADGWVLRNKIVWAKTNPVPTSVRDRLACTWEAIYVLTRQPSYFFDLDAVRIPHRSQPPKRHGVPHAQPELWRGPNGDGARGLDIIKAAGRVGHPLGKNPGDVWHIASSSYRGAHHATFPVGLAQRAIQAGCPERRCASCRLPWRRTAQRLGQIATRGGLWAGCDCDTGAEPGIVLDPFFGAGSTAIAAESLGRDWLGIELKADFARLAWARITEQRTARKSTNQAQPKAA
jgi:site-specific DNA-methyltransferase (adenine-specific)